MSGNIFADFASLYVISKILFPAHYPVNFLDFEFWQKIRGTNIVRTSIINLTFLLVTNFLVTNYKIKRNKVA